MGIIGSMGDFFEAISNNNPFSAAASVASAGKDIFDGIVDINDDALDYIKNYEDCEFIQDEGKTFSNINIRYLSLGSTPMDEWTVYRLTGDTLKALAEE